MKKILLVMLLLVGVSAAQDAAVVVDDADADGFLDDADQCVNVPATEDSVDGCPNLSSIIDLSIYDEKITVLPEYDSGFTIYTPADLIAYDVIRAVILDNNGEVLRKSDPYFLRPSR